MNVKELINILKNITPESEVIIQKDSEGNGYSPLSGVFSGVYVPENTYSGEFYDIDEVNDEVDISDGKNAVVFVPTN